MKQGLFIAAVIVATGYLLFRDNDTINGYLSDLGEPTEAVVAKAKAPAWVDDPRTQALMAELVALKGEVKALTGKLTTMIPPKTDTKLASVGPDQAVVKVDNATIGAKVGTGKNADAPVMDVAARRRALMKLAEDMELRAIDKLVK